MKDQIEESLVIRSELPCGKKLVLSLDFFEWFRGFTDAEGSFIIVKGLGNGFSFHFVIRLHIDDKGVLDYIKKTLGLGTVTVSKTKPEVVFLVRIQDEIRVLLELFTKYPLNSSKHLNFLDFCKAFQLYTENSSPQSRQELRPEIEGIKNGMNSQRTDFSLPRTHYNITKYWLLGFLEGDGWFSFTLRTKTWEFGIAQKGNKALLEAIAEFLQNLASQDELIYSENNNSSVANIYPNKNLGDVYFMVIRRHIILEKLIIPILDPLTWRTKKYLDYCDWKAILNLCNKGFHYIPEGKDLIERILNQMNSNRLSTSKVPTIDRTLLHTEIVELLSEPSNYDIRNGKKYIKSLGRHVRHEILNKALAVQLIDLEW
jgi:hypothetical protein